FSARARCGRTVSGTRKLRMRYFSMAMAEEPPRSFRAVMARLTIVSYDGCQWLSPSLSWRGLSGLRFLGDAGGFAFLASFSFYLEILSILATTFPASAAVCSIV